MTDLNVIMDSIDSSKENIARAIALAFANGDDNKASYYYEDFLKSINDSRAFVFKKYENVYTSYGKKLEGILNKISDFLGEDVKEKFYKKRDYRRSYSDCKINLKVIDGDDLLKLNFNYYFNENMFLRIGVTYYKYITIYREKGVEKAIELSKLVKSLKRLDRFHELKASFSEKQDRKEFFSQIYKVPEMIQKYNIESIGDIMSFYTEICSCLVDEANLGEEEKIFVNDNRTKIINRMGNEELVNNRKELKKIKKFVESMCENEFTKKLIIDSNLNDFFVRHGISVTKKNLEQALFLFLCSHFSAGVNTRIKFEEGAFNVSIFKNSALEQGYLCQNEIIIHELIHSLEPHSTSWPMNDRCLYLNETMTQYFTLESLRYMGDNIVQKETNRGPRFSCSYNFMLPMLNVIKRSPLWDDFVYCKLANDYSLLIDRIGEEAIKISRIFDKVYEYRNTDLELRMDKVDEACFMLKESIASIVRKNERYNKNI